ncbi:MAG: hypothetical protein ACOX3D_07970 [Syntrophomonadales bacterium]|jgi:hypothetical protein
MVVTTETTLLVLLAAFLLFISAITLGLRGAKNKKDDDDWDRRI